MSTHKKILSCDWGTSSFRLRLVNVDNAVVLKETISEKGIAAINDEWLQQDKAESERIGFYKNFLQLVINRNFEDDVKDVPVIMSGMASSTIGMKELAYRELPFDLSVNNLNVLQLKADDECAHDILLVSGLRTAADVMRGEETMLLGCDFKDEDALVIFPGTHSKHVAIQHNVVTDFKTYMTGEVFHLFADKSVLSKSVIKNNKYYQDIFSEGVNEGAAGNLLNSAFHIRTNQLFNRFNKEENYHYLSGMVIGSELKEAASINGKIYLVSSSNLAEQYILALKILTSDNPEYFDADKVLIKAHCRLSAIL